MNKKSLLFVNACVHKETSRTLKIARAAIDDMREEFDVNAIDLEHTHLEPLTTEALAKRSALQQQAEFDAPEFELARLFANADRIVIAAPYWDFGFPASLKLFLENIGIAGIVYRYGEDGRPVGLCKADQLMYITTRGGFVPDDADLGFKTIEATAHFYGIAEVRCISAQGLDIPATDVDEALKKAIASL